MGGLLTELALIAHYEDVTQWIPLALLATGLVTLLCRPLFRATLDAASGSNDDGVGRRRRSARHILPFPWQQEFQLEMDPQMRGIALMWHVLRAKSPPTLRPFR